MLPVKRIEIIANYVELGKILEGLEKTGVEGCTVIRDVAGASTRSNSKHNLAMTMLDNVYIIAFCQPEKITATAEAIRGILNKYGGSCFISDAIELRTTRCVG
ncbi:MAG: P-II family nitrogen regulator [Calothrix sp. FI2-JRJ7]|jgi:nitrogen regulatory protein PII|nr:P-II family nitrogen regulator [Calothrix sp. FI2-JRJ7]